MTAPADGQQPEKQPLAAPVSSPAFAHASEAELARILDFYAVHWEYEPHTFPILWSLDGAVVESFTPDFFLPDLELYVELTTLKQKLVRKKNRKLRRLRELYPGIRIKLFYARDFRMLMLKFGRVDLFDGLSGTVGQVPPRRRDAVAAAEVAVATLDALGLDAEAADAALGMGPDADGDGDVAGDGDAPQSTVAPAEPTASAVPRARDRSAPAGSGDPSTASPGPTGRERPSRNARRRRRRSAAEAAGRG